MRTSLCGCIREPEFLPWESAFNRVVRLQKFCRAIRRHWRDNPACAERVAHDPVWLMRQPVPPDDVPDDDAMVVEVRP